MFIHYNIAFLLKLFFAKGVGRRFARRGRRLSISLVSHSSTNCVGGSDGKPLRCYLYANRINGAISQETWQFLLTKTHTNYFLLIKSIDFIHSMHLLIINMYLAFTRDFACLNVTKIGYGFMYIWNNISRLSI